MTKEQQRLFIHEICDNLKKGLLDKLDKVPENWDGHELRAWAKEYLADNFAYAEMPRKRLKDFKNDLLINNLT